DRHALGWCVHHQAVADVHALVAEVGEEEHDVAGLKLVARDVLARVPLPACEVPQADADMGVGPHHKARAVIGVRYGGAPYVWFSDLSQSPPDRLRAE